MTGAVIIAAGGVVLPAVPVAAGARAGAADHRAAEAAAGAARGVRRCGAEPGGCG